MGSDEVRTREQLESEAMCMYLGEERTDYVHACGLRAHMENARRRNTREKLKHAEAWNRQLEEDIATLKDQVVMFAMLAPLVAHMAHDQGYRMPQGWNSLFSNCAPYVPGSNSRSPQQGNINGNLSTSDYGTQSLWHAMSYKCFFVNDIVFLWGILSVNMFFGVKLYLTT